MKYIIFDVFKNDPLLEPPYSTEEDTKNYTNIERVRKDHDPPYFRSLLLGNRFWKEAVESKHMLGRSFSSLKNRYKKLCESAVKVGEGEPVPAKQAVLSCSQPAATLTAIQKWQYKSQVLAYRLIRKNKSVSVDNVILDTAKGIFHDVQRLTNCMKKEYNS